MNSIYIGISAPYMKDGSETRDGSACAIKVYNDGSVSRLVGIQEERLSRVRYDNNIVKSVQYCLNALDYSVNDKIIVGFSNCMEEPWTEAEVQRLLFKSGVAHPEVIIVDHHVSHAFEAFVASGFLSSVVVIIDGCGNAFDRCGIRCFESQSYYLFSRNTDSSISYSLISEECFEEPGYGELFRSGTRSIGFPGYHHASKLMAIAGIAKSRGVEYDDLNEYVNGCLRLKIPILREDVYTPISNWFSEQGILYAPRDEGWYSSNTYEQNGSDSIRPVDYYLSRSIQESYELFLIKRITSLSRDTSTTNICIGGGNALNCVANGRLFNSGNYSIHVGFSPSDAGQSLGNVLFLLNKYSPRLLMDTERFHSPFIGVPYSKECLLDVLKENHSLIPTFMDRKALVDTITEGVRSDKIIGLFEGGAEFGPRALGHRSILGNPESDGVIERLRKIKQREDYQPFALSSLAGEFGLLDSPYMSFAPIIDTRKYNSIRKVVHSDGTCRIQTVNGTEGLLLFDVLTELKKTGLSGVINTSFNGRGEPIVETPSEAIRFFMEQDEMDALVIDSCYLTRKK